MFFKSNNVFIYKLRKYPSFHATVPLHVRSGWVRFLVGLNCVDLNDPFVAFAGWCRAGPSPRLARQALRLFVVAQNCSTVHGN